MPPRSTLLLLVLSLSACSGKEQALEEDREQRAERQYREAHLVIDFQSDSQLRVFHRSSTRVSLRSLSDLSGHVSRLAAPKERALVVMAKSVEDWPESKLDEIERLLKSAGVTRVIFHGSSAEGVPILRE